MLQNSIIRANKLQKNMIISSWIWLINQALDSMFDWLQINFPEIREDGDIINL